MVVRRDTGAIEHTTFADIANLISSGDLLVRNTTKVFRARLLGTRDSGAPAEVFLLKDLGNGRWEAMVQPGGKLHPPRVVHITPGFDAQIVEVTARGTRIVQLRANGDISEALERYGHVPLPPYIDRSDEAADAGRYQTVYANQSGSVAAPTAGLHFTSDLLRAIEGRGARIANLTLHVGAGTFKPVDADNISGHVMHEEWYDVPAETAAAVNATRESGSRIWAVGTTTLRTLESALEPAGNVRAGSSETSIFIYPPYVVRSVDRLITNFHLPRSTLLMLVAAFAGHELIRRAYETAVRERYRFYSYGDAMVIV